MVMCVVAMVTEKVASVWTPLDDRACEERVGKVVILELAELHVLVHVVCAVNKLV